MDKYVRKSIGLELSDKILVFDEGHNLENATESACSFELSIDDFENAKKAVKKDHK